MIVLVTGDRNVHSQINDTVLSKETCSEQVCIDDGGQVLGELIVGWLGCNVKNIKVKLLLGGQSDVQA